MNEFMEEIEKRIKKDIEMFNKNIEKINENKSELNPALKKIVSLSKMYASDANSYFEKKDFYTSFSCISYAHGLLDAVLSVIEN